MIMSSNKEIVAHIYAELATGNTAPLLESLADDFRFVVMGSSKWSRSCWRWDLTGARLARHS